jgi:hypothetical protein
LEPAPVGLREPLEEAADLEMVGRHGADPRDQILADIFSDGLLVHLGGEVVAALGGIFVEGALEEVEGGVNLALELFLAELENLVWIAHRYAYIYAYFTAWKSAGQEGKSNFSLKK